jgi:hypothetical protein
MKRSSSLRLEQDIDLNKAGLKIWGYDTKRNFVCRLEINGAGIKIFTGTKGGKEIAYANWEQLIKKLKN